MNPLKILFLTAEAAPLVKVGGLGDVAGSLPGALRRLPEVPDVRVCLPFYPSLKDQGLKIKPAASFQVAHQEGPIPGQAFSTQVNGVPFYLIDGPPIKGAKAVYTGENARDGTKFTFFSLAALELARILDWQPDILHAQDWHTSPAVYDLSLIRRSDPAFARTRSLLTVHNLPYLGQGADPALLAFGLPRAHLTPLPDWAKSLPLPLGLLTADRINTVSEGYAAEMLTPEFGAGLDGFLRSRKGDISGILNGLDQEAWDPAQDQALPANYGLDSLGIRKENKIKLLEELGLEPDPSLPLLGMINRMDYQKGVDLVPEALRILPQRRWQAVILGTGDPALEETARQLDLDYPQVRTVLQYNDRLAHRIYGASDLILIPSRYEPCGLTQMIAMRYGCLPLARATGGLRDTIIDYHQGDSRHSTGFLFQDMTGKALAETIQRALLVYQDQRRWKGLQHRGMKSDFSWRKSARKYLALYQELLVEGRQG